MLIWEPTTFETRFSREMCEALSVDSNAYETLSPLTDVNVEDEISGTPQISQNAYRTKIEPGFAQKSSTQNTPHGSLLSFRFEEVKNFLLRPKNALLLNLMHVAGMRFPKMVEPAQAIVQTGHVEVLSRYGGSLFHGSNSFFVSSKIGVKDSKVE